MPVEMSKLELKCRHICSIFLTGSSVYSIGQFLSITAVLFTVLSTRRPLRLNGIVEWRHLIGDMHVTCKETMLCKLFGVPVILVKITSTKFLYCCI